MSSTTRCRASAACNNCHARKSKCDAQDKGTPCSSCQRRGLERCHILPTIRGKYNRKEKSRARMNKKIPGTAAGGETATSPSDDRLSLHEAHSFNPGSSNVSKDEATVRNPGKIVSLGSSSSTKITPRLPISQSSQNEAGRESSWVDLFETFLQTQGIRDTIDKACITYLGESFPLKTILRDCASSDSLRLHHPGPILSAPSPVISTHQSHPPHLSAEDVSYLEHKGAFKFPLKPHLDDLVSVFIDIFYPLYPAVILHDFITQWKTQTLPLILCHAVCFVGATFCELRLIHSLGFGNRREALNSFYTKTKLLFDFGYERDKIILLQTVTLLTFWPSSPNDVWTFYHWVNFGVTMAEALGIHRSLKHLNMTHKDRSLLRRLWWILLIRDAFGSALFGRPPRINGTNCDVEYVTQEDFGCDVEPSSPHPPIIYPPHATYLVHLSELAVILRDIIVYRYSPVAVHIYSVERASIYTRMRKWRAAIPSEIDWDEDSAARSNFTATLSILYDSTIIFMSIGNAKLTSEHIVPQHVGLSNHEPGPDSSIEDAAERIIHLGASLMIHDSLRRMPHETFIGVIVAEAVSFTRISCPDGKTSKLARALVDSAQMIFRSVIDSWDPSSWVIKLFNNLLSKGEVSEQPEEDSSNLASFEEFLTNEFFCDLDINLADFQGPVG